MPAAYEGTDIISCLRSKYIIRREPYIISPSGDISFNRRGIAMSENKLLNLSFEFSVAIVTLVDRVTTPKSSYMTDQLARAGTSVGANIHEAQYAQSKKDFIAKLEIALKESNETSYWLKLMWATKRIDDTTYQQTEKLCGNIRRLLIASCKTAKESLESATLLFRYPFSKNPKAIAFGFFYPRRSRGSPKRAKRVLGVPVGLAWHQRVPRVVWNCGNAAHGIGQRPHFSPFSKKFPFFLTRAKKFLRIVRQNAQTGSGRLLTPFFFVIFPFCRGYDTATTKTAHI